MTPPEGAPAAIDQPGVQPAVEPAAPPADQIATPQPGLRARTARGTLINSGFFVALGTLNLLRAFLVAYFLTTSEFGVWSILLLTLALVGGVKAVLVSDKYIQQSEPDQELAFQKAFTLEVASAAAMIAVLALAAPLVALAYGQSELLVPCLALCLALPGLALQAPSWVFYRRLQFARQRLLQAIDPVVNVAVTLALAASGFGYWSLVVGTIAGAWSGGLASVVFSPYRLALRFERGTLREYASFSAPLVVAMLAGMAMAQMSYFFGDVALGLGAVGAIGLAASFREYTDRIDQIITSTLYPAICRVRDRSDVLLEVFVKSNRLALMWGMPFGLGLAVFAADLVHFGIGDQWEEAIVLLQVFGASAAVNQIGFNWSAFFRARGDTRPIAVASVVGVAAFAVTGVPLLFVAGLEGFAAGLATATLVLLGIRWAYLKRLFPTLSVRRHVARAFVPSIAPVAVVLAMRAIDGGPRTEADAIVELIIYVALTVLGTIAFERSLLREVWGYLRGASRPAWSVT